MNKRQSKKKFSTIRYGAAPTKERRKQNGGVIRENIKTSGKDFIGRYRAARECPLDAYRDANLISRVEHKAGIQFRRIYYGAVLCRPKYTRPISEYEAAQEPTMHENTLNKVYSTLPPDELNAVIDVCGFSEFIWSPQAYEKMRKGLGRLAVQWNLAAVETCGL